MKNVKLLFLAAGIVTMFSFIAAECAFAQEEDPPRCCIGDTDSVSPDLDEETEAPSLDEEILSDDVLLVLEDDTAALNRANFADIDRLASLPKKDLFAAVEYDNKQS